jgi:hypothetical protein
MLQQQQQQMLQQSQQQHGVQQHVYLKQRGFAMQHWQLCLRQSVGHQPSRHLTAAAATRKAVVKQG